MHTKGPWHRNIKPATKYSVVFAGRNTHVARVIVDGLTPEEVEANINLIAAAPDLLEALQTFVTKYEKAPDGELGIGLINGDFFKARDTIKKAKGEQ
jgi:hypothetical protein